MSADCQIHAAHPVQCTLHTLYSTYYTPCTIQMAHFYTTHCKPCTIHTSHLVQLYLAGRLTELDS